MRSDKEDKDDREHPACRNVPRWKRAELERQVDAEGERRLAKRRVTSVESSAARSLHALRAPRS